MSVRVRAPRPVGVRVFATEAEADAWLAEQCRLALEGGDQLAPATRAYWSARLATVQERMARRDRACGQ